MTVFAHAMPFGAELRPDGSIRFRLWASAQQRVSVALLDRDAVLPLCKQENGWFELVTDAAQVGSRYRLELQDGMRVPDPASRYQPEDVHGPSVVIDPRAYSWRVDGWRGRPWHEAIFYELHVGAFGPEGDFDGVRRRLAVAIGKHPRRQGSQLCRLRIVRYLEQGRNRGRRQLALDFGAARSELLGGDRKQMIGLSAGRKRLSRRRAGQVHWHAD